VEDRIGTLEKVFKRAVKIKLQTSAGEKTAA